MKILAFLLSIPSWLMCVRLYSPNFEEQDFREEEIPMYITSVITGLMACLFGCAAFDDDDDPIRGWLKTLPWVIPVAGVVGKFT